MYLFTTLLLVNVNAAGITLPADQYEGEHKITVESYDNAGNPSGTTEKTIKIDKTKPSIATPSQYQFNGTTAIGSTYYNGNITIKVNVADNLSGVKSVKLGSVAMTKNGDTSSPYLIRSLWSSSIFHFSHSSSTATTLYRAVLN